MNDDIPDAQERTKLEALNELHYEIRLHERHARLYRRARRTLAFIALLGGASAFSNVFNSSPLLRAIGGMVVAACAFADTVWDYAARAAEHDSMRRRYCRVLADSSSLTLAQLDARMTRVALDDPGHIESLRWPAQNDVLRSKGYGHLIHKLSTLERVLDLLA